MKAPTHILQLGAEVACYYLGQAVTWYPKNGNYRDSRKCKVIAIDKLTGKLTLQEI